MQSNYSDSFQQMMHEDWNSNPIQSPYTPWIAKTEGPSVLLSALAEIAPDYRLNLKKDTIPSLMEAIIRARPLWFPPDNAWRHYAYAMIKMRLIEHEVPLNTLAFLDVLDWMTEQGVGEARIGDIYTALHGAR